MRTRPMLCGEGLNYGVCVLSLDSPPEENRDAEKALLGEADCGSRRGAVRSPAVRRAVASRDSHSIQAGARRPERRAGNARQPRSLRMSHRDGLTYTEVVAPPVSHNRSRRTWTLRLAASVLALSASVIAQEDSQPSAAEQERIVALMRQYVADFRWPDLAYEQTITGYQGSPFSGKWQKEFTSYTSRLCHDGHLYFRYIGADGKPPARAKWKDGGLSPNDLTAAYRKELLVATVVWDRWDTLRNRRVAVFSYHVSRPNSGWIVAEQGTGSINVPYRGSIYVDPATGGIWRISDLVTEIPASFRTQYIFDVRDYAEVAIGTASYLLPVSWTSVNLIAGKKYRDEWVFRNYRRFNAESSLTFFDSDSTITFPK